MRSSFNALWLKNKKGELVGLSFNADFCSEHERGIDDLKAILKINDSEPEGIQSRIINEIPEKNIFYLEKNKSYTYLVIDHDYKINRLHSKEKNALTYLPEPLEKRYSNDMLTCWYQSGFGIAAKSNEDKQFTKELHQAIINKKVAVWLGGSGAFKNAGLVIAIIDRVDEESAATMYDADLDAKALKLANEMINIESRLKSAGKKFWALTPRWANDDTKTSYPVVYWLNPRSPDDNSGWYTVEELVLWSVNAGPIKKSA